MQLAPTTQFVSFSQGILYRGAGLETVWPQLLAMIAFSAVIFAVSLSRFRSTLVSFQ